MTFEEYDKFTDSTAKYPSKGYNLQYPLTGFLEEAGEMVGVVKKAQRTMNENESYNESVAFETDQNGVSGFTENEAGEKARQKFLLEAGDALWYLNRVVREAGSSLSEVAGMNMRKIAQRVKDGTLLATEKRDE